MLCKIKITEKMESKNILRKVVTANKYLAELNAISKTIPNEAVLLRAISLQEAKDSSAVENIVTTTDEIYKEQIFEDIINNPAVKEVTRYIEALYEGNAIIKREKLLTVNSIVKIQSTLENNDAGIRKQGGTKIVNVKTGEIVHTPPQDYNEIIELLNDLEIFINDDTLYPELDPLIKMAIIHYQFECIHPFLDGNGRTGRIVNVLYLVLKELLDIPNIYLSKYIIEHKQEYYRLFKAVNNDGDWEKWIIFMLDSVAETAKSTSGMVKQISIAMKEVKKIIRDEQKYKFYSQDLINALFIQPYTKIEFIQTKLSVTRKTATDYLQQLCDCGVLQLRKYGKYNFYINTRLFDILIGMPLTSGQSDAQIESVTE